MKSAIALAVVLLALVVGPLAIFTFMPGGARGDIQPVLIFGGAAYLAGMVSVALVIIGAMMFGEELSDYHRMTQHGDQRDQFGGNVVSGVRSNAGDKASTTVQHKQPDSVPLRADPGSPAGGPSPTAGPSAS